MNNFQTIEFLGYIQDETKPYVKFAHIKQIVDYNPDINNDLKRVLKYDDEPRELMFTLNANDKNFKNLLDVSIHAKIIRTISNEPILNTTEEILVNNGFEELSFYAEKQLLTDKNNKLICDEYGLPIYMKERLFLNAEHMVDQDLRICPCPCDIVDGKVLEETDKTGFFDFEG